MKRLYFLATCSASSAAGGVISGQWLTGFCIGISLWWLLMSVDAIFNPIPVTVKPRSGVVHGDCDL